MLPTCIPGGCASEPEMSGALARRAPWISGSRPSLPILGRTRLEYWGRHMYREAHATSFPPSLASTALSIASLSCWSAEEMQLCMRGSVTLAGSLAILPGSVR